MHIHRCGLPALLVLASSWALAACGGGGGGGGGGSDTPPFYVTAMDPPDGTSGVPRTSHVRVTFSLPLDPATIGVGALQVGVTGVGGVPGSVALVPDGTAKSLEFTPSGLLFPSVIHNVIVSSALRSTAGDALAGRTTLVFSTVNPGGGIDLPPPSALRATTGRLAVGRRNHTATLLQDTRVLVCGGFVGGTAVTDRAERYDPGTETFTTYAGRMLLARAGHTATRLADGRVLLAGGWYEASPGTLNTTVEAEVFDPATGTFSPTGDLTIARADHAALRLPDGRVLVTGGSRLEGAFLADHDTAEVWNPATGEWSPWAATMTHTRAVHAMIDLEDGRWLLVGGSDADLRPETFDVATGTFTPRAAAPADHARFGPAVDRFATGDVAVVGGEAVGDVLHFDRAASALLNSGSGTSRPRAYATATRIAPDRILVAGGLDFANGSFVLPTCDLILEGGPTGSSTYATEVRFPTGMANHTATTLADGRILFVGGLNAEYGQPERDGAYLFTP